MKQLTIRAKITLCYTLFMIGLVSVILGLLITLSKGSLLTNQKNQLLKVVQEAMEDTLEGEKVDYFEDGVYLQIYNNRQEFVDGFIPNHFTTTLPLKEGAIQVASQEKLKLYIYDQKIFIPNGPSFWIRGITSTLQSNQMGQIIIRIAFILLPLLVIFSSIIGYFITKRAFRPIRKIQRTAQEITSNKDLSTRINLPKGGDEISKLGETMDYMLAQLEESFNKEKQFTSDASHELRTPITVILTESEYTLQHVDSLQEALESMEVINRQANHISALINQLLFFTRAEKDTLVLNYEPTNIPNLIKQIVDFMKPQGEKRKITLSFENRLLPSTIYTVDPTLFSRALENLIQNAISYGKENGFIKITLLESNAYFAVEVKDNGIGIANEHLNKIWNRFYQVEENRCKKETGSMGLGLSMVKWIMEKHSGKQSVESTPLVGSTFTLYFPKNI